MKNTETAVSVFTKILEENSNRPKYGVGTSLADVGISLDRLTNAYKTALLFGRKDKAMDALRQIGSLILDAAAENEMPAYSPYNDAIRFVVTNANVEAPTKAEPKRERHIVTSIPEKQEKAPCAPCSKRKDKTLESSPSNAFTYTGDLSEINVQKSIPVQHHTDYVYPREHIDKWISDYMQRYMRDGEEFLTRQEIINKFSPRSFKSKCE